MATNVMKHSELRPLQTQLSFPENTTEQPGIRSHLNDMKLSPVQVQESRLIDSTSTYAINRSAKADNQIRPVGVAFDYSALIQAPPSIIPHRIESMPRLRRRASTPGFLGIFYKQRSGFRPDDTKYASGGDEKGSRAVATYGEDLRKVHSSSEQSLSKTNLRQERKSPVHGNGPNMKEPPGQHDVKRSSVSNSGLQILGDPSHERAPRPRLSFSAVSNCTIKQATVLISRPFETTIVQTEKMEKKRKDPVPIELFPAGTQKALIGAIENLNTKGSPLKTTEQPPAVEYVPKIAVMHTSQKLLLYSFAGSDERKPEQIMQIHANSTVSPCDPSRGWSIRISQSKDDSKDVTLRPSPSLTEQADSSNTVTEMTFTLETASEMDNWLMLLNHQIRLVNASEIRPRSLLPTCLETEGPCGPSTTAIETALIDDEDSPREIVFTFRRTSQETRFSDDGGNDRRSLASRYSIVPLQPDIIKKRTDEIVPPVPHPVPSDFRSPLQFQQASTSNAIDLVLSSREQSNLPGPVQQLESDLAGRGLKLNPDSHRRSPPGSSPNLDTAQDEILRGPEASAARGSPVIHQEGSLTLIASEWSPLRRTHSSATKSALPRLSHMRAMSENTRPGLKARDLNEPKRIGLPSSVARNFEPSRKSPHKQVSDSNVLIRTPSGPRTPAKEMSEPIGPQENRSSLRAENFHVDNRALGHLPASVFVQEMDSPRVETCTYFPLEATAPDSRLVSNPRMSLNPEMSLAKTPTGKNGNLFMRDAAITRSIHTRTHSADVLPPIIVDSAQYRPHYWPVSPQDLSVQSSKQPTISERRRNGLQSPNLHLGAINNPTVGGSGPSAGLSSFANGIKLDPGPVESKSTSAGKIEDSRLDSSSTAKPTFAIPVAAQSSQHQADTTALPTMSTDFIPTFSPATLSSPIMPTYSQQPTAALGFVGLAGDLGSSMGIAATQPPLTPLKWSGSGGIKDRVSGIFRK